MTHEVIFSMLDAPFTQSLPKPSPWVSTSGASLESIQRLREVQQFHQSFFSRQGQLHRKNGSTAAVPVAPPPLLLLLSLLLTVNDAAVAAAVAAASATDL